MFSEDYPIAWSYHRNTCRWKRNIPPLPPNKFGETAPYKEYQNVPVFPLPEVELPKMTLAEAISKRHSCRDYATTPLQLHDLTAILKAGYGIKGVKTFETIEFFERMVPSGGGLYPLELYLIVNTVEQVPQGIYHYAIYPSLLEQIYTLEFSRLYISQLFMNQPYIAESSVILVATSFFQRNMRKYGDRGYRYILYEAGHLFQNMNLAATALGLGTLNLGGFFDDEVTKLLRINNEEEIPLYAMAIGIPDEKRSEKVDFGI